MNRNGFDLTELLPRADGQQVIRYRFHERFCKAELTRKVIAKFGGTDQMGLGVHQTDRAQLWPCTIAGTVRRPSKLFTVGRRIGQRPDHAIHGICA
jgi:hypothetical protein